MLMLIRAQETTLQPLREWGFRRLDVCVDLSEDNIIGFGMDLQYISALFFTCILHYVNCALKAIVKSSFPPNVTPNVVNQVSIFSFSTRAN